MNLLSVIRELNSEAFSRLLDDIDNNQKSGSPSWLEISETISGLELKGYDEAGMTRLEATIWKGVAGRTREFRLWSEGLHNAPKKLGPQQSLLAMIENYGFPEAIVWRAYPDDVAQEVGRSGYWDYCSENIAEITGGLSDDQEKTARWTVITIPA